MKKPARVPKYRKHARGQAFVTYKGKTTYLGKYGSDESRTKYRRFLEVRAEYDKLSVGPLESRTVAVLIDLYLEFASTHYVVPALDGDGNPIVGADGRPEFDPSPEFDAMRRVLEVVDLVIGDELAAKVGPVMFVTLQNYLVGQGHCRKNVNRLMSRAKRLFKWACSRELIPGTVYAGLTCIEPLRKGRSKAKESDDVMPVPREVVEATLPFLSSVVADMVRVQRICGMRPSEVCNLRPADIDRSGDIWLYAPQQHKGEWRGQFRMIAIPQAAQAILGPYLDRPANSFCFSPRESEKKRNDARTGKTLPTRRTKIYPAELRRRERQKAERAPTVFTDKKHRYDRNSYRRAITYGIEKAARHKVTVPKWFPYQLRHSAAIEVTNAFGKDFATIWLGHLDPNSTAAYLKQQAPQRVNDLVTLARRLDQHWAAEQQANPPAQSRPATGSVA